MEKENQIYRLARMDVPAFQNVDKIIFGANEKITTKTVLRACVFSRMFTDNPEEGHVERFLFARKTDMYCVNIPKKGKMVYQLNEDGNEFVPVCKYNALEKKFSNSEIKKEIVKELTLRKLTGRKTISIANENFQMSEFVQLKVKNGDTEFECLKFDEYINCVHKMYIPIRKENGEIELRNFPYGQMLYRLTDTPANRNSYLAIPKKTPFMTKVFFKEDENYGKMNLYANGTHVLNDIKESDLDNYMNDIKQYAIDENDFKIVDFADKNTEFYMVYTGVMDNEKGDIEG